MGAQTSAIIKGFDYQHLVSWYYIICLRKPSYNIYKVKIEDSQAGSVDDVTVFKNGAQSGIDFYQIKYHVVQNNLYSLEGLLDSTSGTSIMNKFWKTWKKVITTYPKENITLNLYSNWPGDPKDDVLACVSGEHGSFDDRFYTASLESEIAKKISAWKSSLSASDQEFQDFTKALVFHLGSAFTAELKRKISDRMELVGLKSDDNSLKIAEGIVRDWIKNKTQEITLDILEEKIKNHDLNLPANIEKAASVYFVTVKEHSFDIKPDYVLDWRKYFEKISDKGDHTLLSQYGWNTTLLPELVALEKKLNSETAAKLIRARGYSRLSPWFAFGFIFSEVSGYKIEIDQYGQLWRTDAKPNLDFGLINESGDGEPVGKNNKVVAVGISITSELNNAVRDYVKEHNGIDTLLFIKPERPLGKDCIRDGGDISALVIKAKEIIREFVRKNKAEKLLIFYVGPASAACFLGHNLNAICKEIQIMEYSSQGYFPSFVLS